MTPIDPNATLIEAMEHYRLRVSILKKGLAQEKYRLDLIGRSFLGPKTPREITTVNIATYRDQRLAQINPRTGTTISAATVRLELSLLSNFFEIARIEWGLCDINPVSNVRKPKVPPGRDRRLTAREERLIVRYCHAHQNKELFSIVRLALESAMGQGEILGLRWEYVNLKVGIAHLPETKNGSKRDVPLSPAAKEALIRMGAQASGKIFSYSAAGLKSTWRFMRIRNKIEDLHFHDLRHEATSRLFELGTLDVMEIAAITGHKTLSMLKRYTHLKAQRLVRKLEAPRQRSRQAVLNHLVPYPALIEQAEDRYQIRLLDFGQVASAANTLDDAIQAAQDALLRTLLKALKSSDPIPSPDQYLELIDERHLIMIDPLQTQALVS